MFRFTWKCQPKRINMAVLKSDKIDFETKLLLEEERTFCCDKKVKTLGRYKNYKCISPINGVREHMKQNLTELGEIDNLTIIIRIFNT